MSAPARKRPSALDAPVHLEAAVDNFGVMAASSAEPTETLAPITRLAPKQPVEPREPREPKEPIAPVEPRRVKRSFSIEPWMIAQAHVAQAVAFSKGGEFAPTSTNISAFMEAAIVRHLIYLADRYNGGAPWSVLQGTVH